MPKLNFSKQNLRAEREEADRQAKDNFGRYKFLGILKKNNFEMNDIDFQTLQMPNSAREREDQFNTIQQYKEPQQLPFMKADTLFNAYNTL